MKEILIFTKDISPKVETLKSRLKKNKLKYKVIKLDAKTKRHQQLIQICNVKSNLPQVRIIEEKINKDKSGSLETFYSASYTKFDITEVVALMSGAR